MTQLGTLRVTAHTGCGKTIIAEGGIYSAIKNEKKIIYTSPIKSLSISNFTCLLLFFNVSINS